MYQYDRTAADKQELRSDLTKLETLQKAADTVVDSEQLLGRIKAVLSRDNYNAFRTALSTVKSKVALHLDLDKDKT